MVSKMTLIKPVPSLDSIVLLLSIIMSALVRRLFEVKEICKLVEKIMLGPK